MESRFKNKVHTCCVRKCRNKKGRRHRFPKNHPDTFKAWLEILQPPDYKTLPVDKIYHRYYICDDHFDQDCFVPGTRRGLKVHAVPTLNIPPDSPGKHCVTSKID